MSEIKLTYFPSKAIGEPIRLLFQYGGIDFIDYRFKREEWPKIKPDMPFGQVPVIEENGKIAHQSIAISRYIAKKAKLTGSNEWEDLEIDSIVDTVNDFRTKLAEYHYQTNEAFKEALRGPLFDETIPYYLEKFEQIAKNNNGHLALSRLTWADIYFAGVYEYINLLAGRDLLENQPNLRKVLENVFSIPAIKTWVESRPVTEM
ncbi:hypothetical protein Trydic_g145 [Trypoxylus dichotomus]